MGAITVPAAVMIIFMQGYSHQVPFEALGTCEVARRHLASKLKMPEHSADKAFVCIATSLKGYQEYVAKCRASPDDCPK